MGNKKFIEHKYLTSAILPLKMPIYGRNLNISHRVTELRPQRCAFSIHNSSFSRVQQILKTSMNKNNESYKTMDVHEVYVT